VNDGVKEPYERERKVMVPTPTGLKEKTFVDKKSMVRRYSVEEVRQLMLDMIEANKKNLAEVPFINLPVTPLKDGDILPDGSMATLTQNETNQNI
jgi:hypothetical protein